MANTKSATKGKAAKATTPRKATPVEFNRDYRPGKGLQFDADLFDTVLGPISDLLGDLLIEGRTQKDIESMLKRGLGDPIEVDLKYGKKWLACCVPSGKQGEELRASIVVKPNGDVKLDLRTWYDPNKD